MECAVNKYMNRVIILTLSTHYFAYDEYGTINSNTHTFRTSVPQDYILCSKECSSKLQHRRDTKRRQYHTKIENVKMRSNIQILRRNCGKQNECD